MVCCQRRSKIRPLGGAKVGHFGFGCDTRHEGAARQQRSPYGWRLTGRLGPPGPIRRGLYQVLNRPDFTGGQNSRRIARYGTEEIIEAVFTRVPRTRGAAAYGTPRRLPARSCGADGDRGQTWRLAGQPSRWSSRPSRVAASGLARPVPRRCGSKSLNVRCARCVRPMRV